MYSKAFYISKVRLYYIENSATSLYKKITDIIHFIIQSVILDYSFPFLIPVCYIRLVYRMLNFQIVAIALTSLVKDIFFIQLH